MTGLERCDGPECPVCGCLDTVPCLARNRWGGGSVARFRCRNCGKVFRQGPRWNGQDRQDQQEKATAEEPEPPANREVSPGGAVIYRAVHCPQCGSADVKITSTRRPVRHHKCKACGEAFKSVESG